MNYIGDFVEDFPTLEFKFFTHEITGNSAAVPITLAGTPVLSVYKNGSLVQSTVGLTLIVDFDGITGLNNVVIDLSSDAFYDVANDYQVVITTGTVGGNSTVGRIVAAFSIENRSGERTLTVVSNIATGAAAPSVAAELDVLIAGTEVNTYASTETLDGGYHEISDIGGTIDIYYQFDIGSNNTATSVAMNGRLEGINDIIGVYAYNWITTSWNQIGSLNGVSPGSSDGVAIFTVLNTHTGTGVNEGKVRIRGLGSGLTSSTLYIDRASMRYAAVAAPTAIEVRTEIDTNSTQLTAIVEDTGTTIPDALTIIDDLIDTEVAAIKTVVDNILLDTNELQTDNIPSTLATIASYIDTEITAIISAISTVDTKVDGVTTVTDALAISLGTVDTVVDGIATAVSTVNTSVDGIQSDLDNGIDGLGALKALIVTLDTITDAVKAKTDQLTFTKTLELDTNTQSINSSTIVGDGKTTPWEGE